MLPGAKEEALLRALPRGHSVDHVRPDKREAAAVEGHRDGSLTFHVEDVEELPVLPDSPAAAEATALPPSFDAEELELTSMEAASLELSRTHEKLVSGLEASLGLEFIEAGDVRCVLYY